MPETNEMEAERYARKNLVTFDGPQDLLCRRFGFEDWEDTGVHAVEHTRIDIVGGYGGETHIGLHLLEFDTHGVAPTNHSPLAGTIDGHLGIAEHTACRSDIADMTAIALEHIGQYLQGEHHGCDSIDVHREADILDRLVVKRIVTANKTCTVDEYVHIATLLFYTLVCSNDRIAICDVHGIGKDRA